MIACGVFFKYFLCRDVIAVQIVQSVLDTGTGTLYGNR